MDVLLVTPRYGVSDAYGGEVSAGLLVRELTARGVDVRVACEETDALDVPSAPLTADRVQGLARGADVVHAYNMTALGPTLRGARRAGVPAVVTANSYYATCLWADHTFPNGELCPSCNLAGLRRDYATRNPATVGRRVPTPLARLEVARRTLTLGAYARIIALSEASARRMVEAGVPRENLRVVPNMVDPTHLGDALPPLTPHPEVLNVAALKHTKGQGVLLEALAHLPGARGTLVGDGPDEARFRDLAAKLALGDRARFLGRVAPEALPELYRAARAFAFPIHWEEPFGRVVLEAWSHGTPVVASARGGPGDIIEHEKTGLLVPAGDPRALADALDRVLRDNALAERLRRGGFARVRDFAPDRIMPRLLRVYEEAMGERAPGRTS